MISLKEQEKFIKENGWSTYYNLKYWVHPKTVSEPKKQDYTTYGMDLNSAYCFEKLSLPKFNCYGIPSIGQKQQAIENKTKIIDLLETLEK